MADETKKTYAKKEYHYLDKTNGRVVRIEGVRQPNSRNPDRLWTVKEFNPKTGLFESGTFPEVSWLMLNRLEFLGFSDKK